MMKTLSIHSLIRGSIPIKLPLFLTIGRLVVGPIFLLIYLNYQKLGLSLQVLPFVLLSLLLLAELTDFLDGFLARKFNLVTKLGKILDPMADSITKVTMLLTFTQGFIRLPLLLVFVFLFRDAIISTLRTVCALNGVTLAARTSGKIKAVLQALAISAVIVLMCPYAWGWISLATLQLSSLIIIAAVALYTFASACEYIYANRDYIKQAWKD